MMPHGSPFPAAPSAFACRSIAALLTIGAVLLQRPLLADDAAPISEPIDAVMNQAARLGVPVLAVASSDACREGPILKRRLAAHPALQPLVVRFAIVDLRMSGDGKWTWHRWQDRFDTRRRNTPQVFVVRADGRVTFAGDPPADLAAFLREQLDRCGQSIEPRQADHFEARLEDAARLRAAGDLAGAVGAVMPAIRTPSFARAVTTSAGFRAAVAEGLLKRIAQGAGEPATATQRLAAVEEVVAASEQFVATLPEVTRAANKRLEEINRDTDGREAVRLSQQLHRAAVAARQSAERGVALYGRIIAMHPDSPAAELAATRMATLAP